MCTSPIFFISQRMQSEQDLLPLVFDFTNVFIIIDFAFLLDTMIFSASHVILLSQPIAQPQQPEAGGHSRDSTTKGTFNQSIPISKLYVKQN